MRAPKLMLSLFAISLFGLTGCRLPAKSPDVSLGNPNTPARYRLESVDADLKKRFGLPVKAIQSFSLVEILPKAWWTLFGNAQINTWVEAALAHNPQIDVATANIARAQYLFAAQTGTQKPQVTAGAGVNFGDNINFPIPLGASTQFNANVTVSYAFDFWGKQRASNEAAVQNITLLKWQREAVYLTLAANTVSTALQLASIESQIQSYQTILENQQKTIDLTQKQFQLGGGLKANVLATQAQFANIQAELPSLYAARDITRHRLAILTGVFPSDFAVNNIDLNGIRLPQQLPLTVPASLLTNRPDVGAALSVLAQQNALKDVAYAQRLPNITLQGGVGSQAFKLADLLDAGLYGVGFNLLQPLWNGGALKNQELAAMESAQAALGAYRSTVLNAFGEVANSLTAIEHDQIQRQARQTALKISAENLALQRTQFQLGGGTLLQVLEAQRQYQLAKVAQTQADATYYQDVAGLFQALGGSLRHTDEAYLK